MTGRIFRCDLSDARFVLATLERLLNVDIDDAPPHYDEHARGVLYALRLPYRCSLADQRCLEDRIDAICQQAVSLHTVIDAPSGLRRPASWGGRA